MIRNHIDLITLGCSKNLVDTERLMLQLQHAGYTTSHDPEKVKGEIVVVNTCGFIGDAKEESINMILQLSEAKNHGQIRQLYVMGCLSERYHADLKEGITEVDGYYGKFNWGNLLQRLGKSWSEENAERRILTTPPHYAYIKISEGCDRSCAYCAIPIITGRHQSRTIEKIEEEVRLLVLQGVKEFLIIAQDLTYYGLDLYRKAALPELIERLAKIEGVGWIKLHYGFPSRFPMDLLRVMREYDNVCAYMDIALQHSNTAVLKRMRRPINAEGTRQLIDRIRKEVPNIHLRTTMMVGFPGETNEEFNELLDFVRYARFERLGAFMYSEEEGTYAAEHYKDDVPIEVKQQRLDALMMTQEDISFEIQQEKIGNSFKTIIDSEDEDYYIGRTQFDSPEVDPEVYISKDKPLQIGSFYDITITDATPHELYGSIS